MLTFSGWQWAAAITGLNVPDLSLAIPKAVLIARSALFGLTSLGLAFGIFFAKPWASQATRWTGLIILVWFAVERAIFSVSDFAARTLPGTLILGFLIWGVLIFALQRREVKKYFGEHKV